MINGDFEGRLARLEQRTHELAGMMRGASGRSGSVLPGRASSRAPVQAFERPALLPEPLWHLPYDVTHRLIVYEDFVQGAEGLNGVGVVASSGALSAQSVDGNGRLGLLRGTTGSSSSGRSAISTHTGIVRLGASAWYGRADIRLDALSTSGERYVFRAGLMDSVTGNPSNGVYFEYSDNLTSGRWRLVANDNGTATAEDSDVAVEADVWYALEWEIDFDATRATFRINGFPAGYVYENIPVQAGREVGFVPFYLLKTVGTTSAAADIDLCLCVGHLTSPDGSRGINARSQFGFDSMPASEL